MSNMLGNINNYISDLLHSTQVNNTEDNCSFNEKKNKEIHHFCQESLERRGNKIFPTQTKHSIDMNCFRKMDNFYDEIYVLYVICVSIQDQIIISTFSKMGIIFISQSSDHSKIKLAIIGNGVSSSPSFYITKSQRCFYVNVVIGNDLNFFLFISLSRSIRFVFYNKPLTNTNCRDVWRYWFISLFTIKHPILLDKLISIFQNMVT